MATTKQPIILSVDDDPQVLRSIKRDLRNQYRQDYRIISTESALQALEALAELKKNGEEVALFLSDQRMPEMLGVDFLEQAKAIFPAAKRVLLTAYSDTNAAIRAINDVQLDYYLVKPWDPPAERLYPVLDDLLGDWQNAYVAPYTGVRVIGHQYAPQSHAIKDFLSGQLLSYQWLDVATNMKASEVMMEFQKSGKDLPLVVLEDGTALSNPTVTELAQSMGMQTNASSELYDVVIIGAGPAGLAAAVYGGSEGLKTLLIERRAPGGQAGTSSRIENYLGFPSGLSGSDLARRAITQAIRFGVEFLSPQMVEEITVEGNYKQLRLSDGKTIIAKSVVLSTGVDYRRLPAEGADRFSGAGVYYGAAITEAASCRNKQVYLVGGGNSAGQGAVYLSKYADKVTIVIRRADLTSSMSHYLIEQIEQIPNIEVLGHTEVIQACGDDHLESLVLTNVKTGANQEVAADALFVFIGAKPATEWMPDNILLDNKGYLLTGRDLRMRADYKGFWHKDREPLLLETCQPGIFAAGDVRSGAMNRVASAVGEGAMAIKFVHEYLAEI
ncbi:MAG: fused response regulator/thioredoxin-disulfide reductase [Bacteroidetes bacterium]|nr:MAG: fused response regulator/thioredoxin-disulfide reductase [Bacteroidota bacterium]PTM13915.1 MAG: fused response regulator/thioredoxin-disulfide reductase [Bacteroidota bacterium]